MVFTFKTRNWYLHYVKLLVEKDKWDLKYFNVSWILNTRYCTSNTIQTWFLLNCPLFIWSLCTWPLLYDLCILELCSQADSSRSLTKHRKIASSFRDLQLFEIFQLSCELLQTAAGNIKSMDFSDDSQVCRWCVYMNTQKWLKVRHYCYFSIYM